MSLPESWVNRIFQRLTLVYGRDFLSRYEGQDLGAVRAGWGEELTGFQQAPDAIKFALEILPSDKPPTVLQFRDLCRKAPQYAPKALPAPAPDPAIAAKALEALRPAKRVDPLQWAHDLKEREERDTRKSLTEFQRKAWREALGVAA